MPNPPVHLIKLTHNAQTSLYGPPPGPLLPLSVRVNDIRAMKSRMESFSAHADQFNLPFSPEGSRFVRRVSLSRVSPVLVFKRQQIVDSIRVNFELATHKPAPMSPFDILCYNSTQDTYLRVCDSLTERDRRSGSSSLYCP